MAVSLRWLVGRRRLGLTVLTGADGLDRDVAYVLTTELADPTPWLSGGEMILVTGLGLPDSDDDLDRYVRRLGARGVVAIGFGVGVSREAVPPGLIGAARAHGLPLVSVPRPTTFLAVTKAFSERAEALRARAHEATAAAQPRLTRAAVTGGRSAMLTELAKACQGSALLLDPHGRLVDARPAPPSYETLAAVNALARTVRAGTAGGPTPDGPAVLHTVRAADRTYGYLAVVTAQEPRPTDHVLIGHANSLLTLDFEKPRQVDETAARINAAALGLLICDDGDLDPVFALVATAADPTGRVRVLTVLGDDDGTAALAGHLEQALRAAARPAFVTVAGDGAIHVLIRGDDDVDLVRVLVDGLPVRVRRKLRTGLSSAAPVREIATAAASSRTAAEAARPGGRPQDATTLVGHTLLDSPETGGALRELARIYVAPLAAHDDAHGTALVPSLRAYLECHGQWEAASGALGVHRHTLRSRIEKAQALLDIDLESARVRAELLLAVLAHRRTGGTG
ncbi:MAG: PucR family transcriptional regulator ligand-binding domain-containing protein [Gordonia sp. (in: high G+C Gram-positive bacteria)]|uniref:PucR family transcriptional regulator n=1 Tax=Gordonia sp. (in: high G+C Gram-positive bacteria) TaxID=84139 RepID=UPI0039E68028